MQNYARYGSYYAEILSSLEENYPGLKNQLSKTGLTIQGQDRYHIKHLQRVGQRGEL